jgi:hypothetical protein
MSCQVTRVNFTNKQNKSQFKFKTFQVDGAKCETDIIFAKFGQFRLPNGKFKSNYREHFLKMSFSTGKIKSYYSPRNLQSSAVNANAFCQANNLQLAVFENADESYYVQAALKNYTALPGVGSFYATFGAYSPVLGSRTEWYFLGLGKTSYTWNWTPGMPDFSGYCGAFIPPNYLHDDFPCDWNSRPICSLTV